MNLDTIRLSQGIGDLSFGMKKMAIVSALGNEYSEDTNEFGDVDLQYTQLGLCFTLWKDSAFRLGRIDSERETAVLCGEQLIGGSKEDVRRFVQEKLHRMISEEDGCEHEDRSIQEWIEVDESNVTFWFRNDALYSIDWMCAWTDEDTPKWPTKRA